MNSAFLRVLLRILAAPAWALAERIHEWYLRTLHRSATFEIQHLESEALTHDARVHHAVRHRDNLSARISALRARRDKRFRALRLWSSM